MVDDTDRELEEIGKKLDKEKGKESSMNDVEPVQAVKKKVRILADLVMLSTKSTNHLFISVETSV
jgi:hypothetical protein